MADEITVIRRGNGKVQALMLFTADAKTRPDPEGGPAITIVQTPMDDTELEQYITAAELASINAGTLIWSIVSFSPADGISNPDLLARAQELYPKEETRLKAELDNTYWKRGQRFDKS